MPDSEGFDEFYRGSRQRLLGFVYVLTGNLAEAQDAVQEAYIRAWQRWSTVRGYDDPEAWLRVVASRIAVNRRPAPFKRYRVRVRLKLRAPPDGVGRSLESALAERRTVREFSRAPGRRRRAQRAMKARGASAATTG